MNSEEPSLLSHLNEIRTSRLPEGGISNILICSKVKNETDIESALALHRLYVQEQENLTENFSGKINLTGLLISQGNSILHFLEGPNFMILRILSDLSADPVQALGRVVYCVEDQPLRYYADWVGGRGGDIEEKENIKKSTTDDITADSYLDFVHDMVRKLAQVGHVLQTASNKAELLGKYQEHLPVKHDVISLSNSNLFFSIKEFVEVYADTYHIELESEQSWPLQPLVKYYT